MNGTARSVLRDWVAGRIPYYTAPPPPPAAGTLAASAVPSVIGTVSSDDVNSAALLTTFAPAFNLAALFGEADAVAFGEAAAGSGLVGKGVRMDGVEGESEDANVGWITGDGDEEDMEEMEQDDGLNVDDLLEDEEDDDEDVLPVDGDAMEEDEPMVVAPPVAKKLSAKAKKAAALASNIVSVAPTKKSVSFAAKALGPTGGIASTSASQKAKLFANDEEAPG